VVITDLAPLQSALKERFQTVSLEWDDHRRKVKVLVNDQREFIINALKMDTAEAVELITSAMGEWDGAG
jgi:hypothetical protein